MVICETPANPTLDLVDISDIVEQAGDVPVLVDSTFATPILQQPSRHGAALTLHSATKFLGGHGDVVGGAVACEPVWAARLRAVRAVTGALLHPLAAYLLLRGLPTLPLRVEAQQRTATQVAAYLASHPAVARVHHPSRPGADPLGLLGKQQGGPGSLLAFDVRGGGPHARAVAAGLHLVTHAVSLGGTDSLIQHPASLTHRPVEDGRQTGGVTAADVGRAGGRRGPGRRPRPGAEPPSGSAGDSMSPVDLAALDQIQRRVLWLATRIVDAANHERDTHDGVKVGGHQASSASLVSVMTALWFHHLEAADRVAVKPHASPVLHAIQYLLGDLDRSYLTRCGSEGPAVLPLTHQGPGPGGLLHGVRRAGSGGPAVRCRDPPVRRRALRRARDLPVRRRCWATPSWTRATSGRRSPTR